MSKKWDRHRFRADPDDYRPVKWPPPGPYWCSGYGENYNIVIAYAPAGTDIRPWWPEMEGDDVEERQEITFTDRFPEPEWWKEIVAASTSNGEVAINGQ